MTKTTYQALFLAYLSLQVLVLKSQDHPLSFNAGYGIGIEAYESTNTLGLDNFEDSFDNYGTSKIPYSSWLSHQATLGVEYKFLSFAGAGFNLGYAKIASDDFWEGNRYYRTRALLELTDWRFQPYVKLDVLFNSEHEALNFGAGLNIFHRSHRTSHIAESDTGTQAELKHLLLNRRGWASAYFLELEWEDYFSPHFGYFIAFRWFPGYIFEPTRVEIEESRVEGETMPSEASVYDYGAPPLDDSAERFVMNAIYFQIGLKYRL